MTPNNNEYLDMAEEIREGAQLWELAEHIISGLVDQLGLMNVFEAAAAVADRRGWKEDAKWSRRAAANVEH